MAGTGWTVRVPAAEPLDTVYVHLSSGEVTEVRDVERIEMTDTHVIFTRRGDLEPVVLERRDIYYICREPGDAPPAF